MSLSREASCSMWGQFVGALRVGGSASEFTVLTQPLGRAGYAGSLGSEGLVLGLVPLRAEGPMSRVSAPRQRARQKLYFYDLPPVPEHHFCLTVLVESHKGLPVSRGGDVGPTAGWLSAKALKEHVGLATFGNNHLPHEATVWKTASGLRLESEGP